MEKFVFIFRIFILICKCLSLTLGTDTRSSLHGFDQSNSGIRDDPFLSAYGFQPSPSGMGIGQSFSGYGLQPSASGLEVQQSASGFGAGGTISGYGLQPFAAGMLARPTFSGYGFQPSVYNTGLLNSASGIGSGLSFPDNGIQQYNTGMPGYGLQGNNLWTGTKPFNSGLSQQNFASGVGTESSITGIRQPYATSGLGPTFPGNRLPNLNAGTLLGYPFSQNGMTNPASGMNVGLSIPGYGQQHSNSGFGIEPSASGTGIGSPVSIQGSQNPALGIGTGNFPAGYDMALQNDLGLLNLLPFSNQVTRSEFTGLSTNVAALATILAQLLPKCSSTVPPGTKKSGNFCYHVYTTPANYNTARSTCNSNGGFIAEPLPQSSTAFYATMKTLFPNEFDIIRPEGKIWLGLLQPGSDNPTGTPFVYLSNMVQVALPSIFVSPSTSRNTNGAVLVFPGTTWTSYDASSVASKVTTLPYICQYNTV